MTEYLNCTLLSRDQAGDLQESGGAAAVVVGTWGARGAGGGVEGTRVVVATNHHIGVGISGAALGDDIRAIGGLEGPLSHGEATVNELTLDPVGSRVHLGQEGVAGGQVRVGTLAREVQVKLGQTFAVHLGQSGWQCQRGR